MLLRAASAGALLVASPAIVRAQSILLPRATGRGLYFPPGMPKLDRNHRLAFGLAFLSVAATMIPNTDLWSGVSALQINSSASAPVMRGTTVGEAVFFGNGTNENINWWNGSSQPTLQFKTSNGTGTGDFTMLVVANPSASGSQQNFLFCQRNSISLVQADLVANVDGSNAQSSGAFTLQTYNGTFVCASAASALDGNFHAFVGKRTGTTLAVYKGGAQLATGSGAAQAVWDSGVIIGYGGLIPNAGSARGASSGIACAAAWNRALADDEIEQVSTDPTSMLIYPEEDMMATIGGSGARARGGSSLPLMGVGSF